MVLEKYLKEYEKLLKMVRKETYRKHRTDAVMLFEFIDNWIDFFPRKREVFEQAVNSLSGIILLHSWKLTNWITYQILCGKYFEAIRNLRFIFEGSVYAVIVEDAIERVVFRHWGSLSRIDLKTEIFKLLEECRRKRVYRNGKIDKERIRKIVEPFVKQNIHPSKTNQVDKYIEVYAEILSDTRLYLSVGKMINEAAKHLKLKEKDIEDLSRTWHELSRYLHFSYPFLEAILDDPEFLIIEKVNSKLFKKSLDFYFKTLDFFYTVLAWRFPQLEMKIREVIEWWRKKFNKTFRLTEQFLGSL